MSTDVNFQLTPKVKSIKNDMVGKKKLKWKPTTTTPLRTCNTEYGLFYIL